MSPLRKRSCIHVANGEEPSKTCAGTATPMFISLRVGSVPCLYNDVMHVLRPVTYELYTSRGNEALLFKVQQNSCNLEVDTLDIPLL